MAEILSIRHERIDDVPLILGVANQLRLAEILNTHLGTHGLQQGLHNGQLAVGWLGYILSQADHRKSAVRDWANDLPDTHRLSDDAAWEAIERDKNETPQVMRRFVLILWAASVIVYELPLTGVRLDSTTSYGYHQPSTEGLMQYGNSKDHRPDLPQLKLMAAVAEPIGHLIACEVKGGQYADDPLYTPLIQRVRSIVGRRGLLYVGDCKMAVLNTRAEVVANPDFYLVPLQLSIVNCQ